MSLTISHIQTKSKKEPPSFIYNTLNLQALLNNQIEKWQL